MIDLNNLWVTINLREDRFNALKIGDVIEGAIPALKYKNVKFRVFLLTPKEILPHGERLVSQAVMTSEHLKYGYIR